MLRIFSVFATTTTSSSTEICFPVGIHILESLCAVIKINKKYTHTIDTRKMIERKERFNNDIIRYSISTKSPPFGFRKKNMTRCNLTLVRLILELSFY